MNKPHIVIIGAGFGGTYVARHLLKAAERGEIDVTLINRTNYFLFTPLLHEVATGSLTPTSVTESLAEILEGSKVRLVVGEATLNTTKKTVKVNGTEFPFDYAVVTTGAQTNYFNIDGAQKFSLPLKTVGDAMDIREQVIRAFEGAHACKNREERKKMLSFVITGAGPTGVELTAELAEFANEIEKRYHHSKGELSVTLVSADETILKMLPERLRQKATDYLDKKLGVRILTKKMVTSVSKTSVTFSDGHSIDAGLTIWTAGVASEAPKTNPPILPLERGRLVVDETLCISGQDTIFALGDVALIKDMHHGGTPVPMLAQAATAQAKIVAKNIFASIAKKPLKPFCFRSKGMLVSLGEWNAIGAIGPVHVFGPIAWFIWRTVYLFKFLSVKKRFRIAFEWTVNLFTTRDITQLGKGLL